MKKLSNQTKNRVVICVFFIALLLSQLVMIISAVASDGYSFHSLFYNYYAESFMDFFNKFDGSLIKNPYNAMEIGSYSIASPLSMLVFKFATNFAKNEIYDMDKSYLPHFSETLLIYFVFSIIVIVAISILLFNKKKGKTLTKVGFLYLVLFSAPFLINYERGNIIILSLLFLLLYIFNYDSETTYVRHLSYVALALSVTIKPLTVVFAILIFKKKRVKEGFLSLLYSLVLWIIPAFFYNGFDTIVSIFKNIPDVFKQVSEGIAYKVDIFSGINAISMTLGYGNVNSTVKYVIGGILIAALFACVILSKSVWRQALALSMIVISGSVFDRQASLVLLVIPLLFLLDSDKERKAMDVVYTLLITFIFAPLAIKDCILNFSANEGAEIYLYSYIALISSTIITILLFLETVTLPLAGIELTNKEQASKDKCF